MPLDLSVDKILDEITSLRARLAALETREHTHTIASGSITSAMLADTYLKNDGTVTGVVLASEGIDYRVRVDKDSLIYELTAGNLTVGRSFVVNDVHNRPLFQFSLQDKQPPPPPPGPTPQVAKPGEGTDEAIQDILKPKDKDKDKPKP